MAKQLFFLVFFILNSFLLTGQEDEVYTEDHIEVSNGDSLYLNPASMATKGEVFVSLGYLNAIRGDGAFNYESASIGAGVELSPGKIAIGISAMFAYRNVTEKFFKNLYYPQIQIYGLYNVWSNSPHFINVGIGASYLTNAFMERMVFNGEEYYLGRFENQNFLSVMLKSNYKFYLPIGQRQQAKLAFSAFFDVGIPVVAFALSDQSPYSLVKYDNWLYRLGFNAGFRFGFGK